MIQANELKINNLVRYDGKDQRVYAINFHDSQMQPYRVLLDGQRSKMGISLNEIHGIPLTSEILEKAGFRHYKKRDVYGIDWGSPDRNLYLGFYSTGIFPTLVKEGEMVCDPTGAITLNKIEHLHQLQNLYFSLTGTELNIQL